MHNPWDDIEAKYPVGSRVRGKVVNLVPYGAFVELEEGVEGLVHVSETVLDQARRPGLRRARASARTSTPSCSNINKDEQKISLGIRQTESNPWDAVAEKYPIGTRVKGKVRNFTTYGAFVELEEGIDGMIHVSDMSWTRKINHPSEVLKKGDEVEAVVLEVDTANQRISLGLKQAPRIRGATSTSRYKVGRARQGQGHQARVLRRVRRPQGGHRRPRPHLPDQRRARREGQGRAQGRARKSRPASSRSTRSSAASASASRPPTTPPNNSRPNRPCSDSLKPGEDLVALQHAFDAADEERREAHQTDEEALASVASPQPGRTAVSPPVSLPGTTRVNRASHGGVR